MTYRCHNCYATNAAEGAADHCVHCENKVLRADLAAAKALLKSTRGVLIHVEQAYANRHSPQHRDAAWASVAGAVAAIDAAIGSKR